VRIYAGDDANPIQIAIDFQVVRRDAAAADKGYF
jgi:hypothetical protein